MREKLDVVLDWLERAATIVAIVVPATRKVADLTRQNNFCELPGHAVYTVCLFSYVGGVV